MSGIDYKFFQHPKLAFVFLMDKYVCGPCGYVYDPADGDPDNDIDPETKFEDLPEDSL